jgi:tRNA A37 threonylcarbamoyladenosine synthetase subunit TsaC/SUA5/YrdC
MNPNLVYLTQTDTTVGFLSQDKAALAKAKKRDPKQPFLICVDSFKKQKKLVRTPKKYKKSLRRSKRTTFLFPNKKAIRVVTDHPHSRFLEQFTFMYSSSANENGKPYNFSYAWKHADVIVEDAEGFHEGYASKMYRLGKRTKIKLR